MSGTNPRTPLPGASIYERRTLATYRHLSRQLNQDVLTAHLVLSSALQGRTSPDHVRRAYRRAASTALRLIHGPICPVCQRSLGPRVWIVYKGMPYEVDPSHTLARDRAYCREHCAVQSLITLGRSFIASPDLSDPDVTLPPAPVEWPDGHPVRELARAMREAHERRTK